MKKLLIFLVALFAFLPLSVKAQGQVNIYLFHGQECRHCEEERGYLEELASKNSNINLVYYEVWHNEINANVMYNLKSELTPSFNSVAVPFTIIGNQEFLGFSSASKANFESAIANYKGDIDIVANQVSNLMSDSGSLPKIVGPIANYEGTDTVREIDFFGKVDLKELSLPLVSVVFGTLDGFNPCAMWVLLFLISMLLGMKDRKRMWALGIAFLVTSGLIYFLIMLSLIKAVESLNTISLMNIILGLVCLTGAYLNFRSYQKQKDDGCVVVDDKKRSKIFTQIKEFTTEKNFWLALVGVVVLAASVNLVELACSTVFPATFATILEVNNASAIQRFIYTLIYMFFFMLDDIIVFTIAMVTLQMKGISTKYSKYSHLIGAIIMLIIGLLLLFRPDWLRLNF